MDKDKKVSLKDIANHLGVSTALVSYALNKKDKEARVGAEMAEKIRKAAVELNYQPNIIAQSLKRGTTNTIGLIVADISNPFFSSIARIIEDEARKYGYIVIFGSSDENEAQSKLLIDVLMSRRVDAFIIAPSEHTEKQIKGLLKRKVPVVLIDRYFPNVDTDFVQTNNFQVAYEAVEHLIKNGRDRVGMMAYDTGLQHMQDRINGYKEALKDNGIKFKPSWLRKVSHPHLVRDVQSGIKSLVVPELKVNGFFFATNTLAVESLKIINHSGIRVPDDLALISFDESIAFDFFYSPLTYIRQSIEELATEAVRLAIARIGDKERKPESVVVDAKLIVRSSSRGKGKK